MVGPPLASILLSFLPWSSVFEIFSIILLITLILVPILKIELSNTNINNENEKITDAVFVALKDPTYSMLFFGFFSCGFQLAFITAHFPAFIVESSSPIIAVSYTHLTLPTMDSV